MGVERRDRPAAGGRVGCVPSDSPVVSVSPGRVSVAQKTAGTTADTTTARPGADGGRNGFAPRRRRRTVASDRWLYGWGLGYAAVGGASLLVPLYAIELGAGAFVVGLIAATAAFAGVPGALLWGRLAARTERRRPFVLVTLGATAGVLALVPLLASPWTVLVANAALWFVVAAAAPVLNLIAIE
ncbi:MAG: MFS transporter, partial [Haloferacaceae archaeon]